MSEATVSPTAAVESARDADQESGRYADQAVIEQAVSTLYQGARARVKALAHRFDPELQPAGYGILRHVMLHEPVRAGDIVTAIGTDKSAVSRQVAVLKEKGLIDFREDPADRRASLLVLTDRARAVRIGFKQEMREIYGQMLADWSDEEIATFARLLGKFNDSSDRAESSAGSRTEDSESSPA